MSLLARFCGLIDAFQPADGPPPQRLWPFFRWSLRGGERAILFGVVINVLMGLSELVTAHITGWAVDVAVSGGPEDLSAFWPIVPVALIFFLILRPIIFATDSAVSNILVGAHVFPLVLSRVNRHTLGQSLRFFENDFAGRISQKGIQTARAVSDVVKETLEVVVYVIAIFTGAMVIFAGVDMRYLLMFGVWFGIWFLFLRAWIPRVQRESAARAGARTMVSGQIVDAYSNITTVKLFAHDDFEDQAALQAMETYRQRAVDFGVATATFRFVLITLGGTLPLMVIGSAIYLWAQGQASIGDIAMVAIISTRLAQVTNRVSTAFVSIFANIGEIEDGIKTLSPGHEIIDRPEARTSISAKGAMAFQGLTFGYGGSAAALSDFSLDIAAGEKVALVGASGAGKSTVTSLLLRLYDVEGGQILLDGQDIRSFSQTALRQQIAVVRQETAMFNRPAYDNILYGRPGATEAEVHDAARRASAHDFILGLEDFRGRKGYSAYLGERGVKLSGGQRQRVALARAILKDAPVLVLDEATSALDSEVEAEIQAALTEVMTGKTVIAIAHRLSTIQAMDRIVVMEAGRIVEQGPHDALLSAGGTYARFWSRQSGGFADTRAAE